MKDLLSIATLALLLALVIPGASLAAEPESIESVAQTIRYHETTGKVRFAKLRAGVSVSQNDFPSWFSQTMGLPASAMLVAEQQQTDNLGFVHITYRQHVNGIPVEPGVLKAHFQNGTLVSFNGDYHTEAPASSSFLLNESTALLAAKGFMGAKVYRYEAEQLAAPKGQKLLLLNDADQLVPAWAFRLYAYDPHDRQDVFVDATNGNLLGMVKRLYNASANGTAQTKYSGAQNIITDSLATDSFRLVDTTRGTGVETYNLLNGLFQTNAVDFWDDDNNWNNVNTAQDEVATDAHWAGEMFYDYFQTSFGRNSYDDAGGALICYVHYFVNYTNAFWDGTSVSVGDGDGTTYGPLTTVDIIAHEYTHGVIENTSNFTFSFEPGALTESYADIFGTMVEFYAKPSSANWTIQEDASLSNPKVPARSLADPKAYSQPDTYQGQFWEFGSADNGGVHTNGGVQNHWFYLLANGGAGTNDNSDLYNVQGIGNTAAAAIAYRALNVYHTNSSQYSDALTLTIQAAEDLYGACSQEVISTQEAWFAVGVGTSTNPTTAAFTVDQTFSCQTPTTVQFTDQSQNAVSWFWDFGDNETDTTQNPSHQYDTAGVYTVMLVATGVGCAGAPDTMIQNNLITVTAGGGPITPSCSPPTQNPGSATNFGIYNVIFANINNSTNGGVDDYQDYTCS